MHRREFLLSSAATVTWALTPRAFGAGLPTDDPLASYKQKWTTEIKWANAFDITQAPGDTIDQKLAAAQAMLAAKGGGTIIFPAGVYKFTDSIKLLDGIVLRGEAPFTASAKSEQYALKTQFEFPKYEPVFEGDGTPIGKAFKGVYLADPATASNVGLVHIAMNRGHIHFHDAGESAKFACGKNRFVLGCILRNAAVADPSLPKLDLGQKPWQRFTARHHAAIDVKAAENLLVANNRLPKSGDDNFTMNGYLLEEAKKKMIAVDGVVFDYDNRPGLYVNHYNIGGAGGMGPDGTPESHPQGFRKGTIIVDNFLFNTGRMGIGFSGDGVLCRGNVIRIPDHIWRPTATGVAATKGSSTNDNRALEMRGWRWTVDDNEYTVHRNWAYDKKYKINDGEGLMHEDHANSLIKDSILTNNRGNTYLSLYKTAGIDGLLVEGNDIRLGDGKQTIASGAAIFVSADRTKDRFPIRNVSILKNTVAGGGILISGEPSEKNIIKGNKAIGPKATIKLQAEAEVVDNDNFDIVKGDAPKKR